MSNVNFFTAQILGGIATLILCLSYIVKSKKGFLLLGLFGDIAYGMSFLFVGSWGAGVIALLSCVQYLFFYHYDKKHKSLPISIALIFVFLFVVVSTLTWSSIWDIVPLACYVWYTLVLYIDDVKTIRTMYFVPNALSVVYDIMVMAYASAFEDGIEAMFLLVMITIDLVKNQKSKICFVQSSKAIFVSKLRGTIFNGLQSAGLQVKNANFIILSNKNKECNVCHIPSFCKFSKVSFY